MSASKGMATDSPLKYSRPGLGLSFYGEDKLHSFRSPQKVSRLFSGRSPDFERGTSRMPNRFTFPNPRQIKWYFEAVNARSQWRDRAGLTPDFPFMPLWAPEVSTLPHAQAGVNEVEWFWNRNYSGLN
jgi:hypothetical protein